MNKLNKLKKISADLRKFIYTVALDRVGHISSSFSCLELLISLHHGKILKIKNTKPKASLRDRFILSKGHAELAYYSVLADIKFFSKKKFINSYKKNNYFFGGHVSHKVPGVELSTGSLGHGLSYGCGVAFAAKLDKKKFRTFVLLGDGECTEGSVWEAALFASKNKLNNLIAIIDNNNIAALDYLNNFTKLSPLKKKWQSFNWEVYEINGHDFKEIFSTFKKINSSKNSMPKIIIAKTTKGKGLSFMENDPIWHTKKLSNKDEIDKGKKELGC